MRKTGREGEKATLWAAHQWFHISMNTDTPLWSSTRVTICVWIILLFPTGAMLLLQTISKYKWRRRENVVSWKERRIQREVRLQAWRRLKTRSDEIRDGWEGRKLSREEKEKIIDEERETDRQTERERSGERKKENWNRKKKSKKIKIKKQKWEKKNEIERGLTERED